MLFWRTYMYLCLFVCFKLFSDPNHRMNGTLPAGMEARPMKRTADLIDNEGGSQKVARVTKTTINMSPTETDFQNMDPFAPYRKCSARSKNSEILDITMVDFVSIVIKNAVDFEKAGCFGKKINTSQKTRYVSAFQAVKSCVAEDDTKFFKSENYPRGKGIAAAEKQTEFERNLKRAIKDALEVSCELRHPIANVA